MTTHRSRLATLALLASSLALLAACTPEGTGGASSGTSSTSSAPRPGASGVKSNTPATSTSADGAPATSGAPSAVTPTLSGAPEASSAPVADGPTTPEGYSLAGIKTLAEGCKTPWIIFSAAKKGAFGINMWPMTDQMFQAHPQFKIVQAVPAAPMEVRLEMFELASAPDAIVLTGRCADASTCNRVAAAYHAVVPSGKNYSLACAERVPGTVGKETVLQLSPKVLDDVVTQCARIGVCSHKADRNLKEDVHLGCQKAPSNYNLKCAMKESCDAVTACLKK